ncbi:radical SAM protein [archaeon]|jgi:MoaA/NifB/PqqE/SkfB family radical SAM enzyme|nr:radical SAM protein [archaeon]MBT4647641.1 radical SAM protein [archaeon]MBT6822617.1 radical SAM protein [archaeon]MBT7392802.1 radical SAM protein [archaeon]
MNTRIVLILTTRCNFKCRHCIREYYNKHYDISFPLLKKSLKEAKELGFNQISLTGGEPILYPNFNELVDFISRNNLKWNILSNGSLYNKYEKSIDKNKSNLEFISLSLDGATEKTHDYIREKGSFKKVIKAAKFYKKKNIKLKISFITNLKNINEIDKLIDLSKKLHIDSIKIGSVVPTGYNSDLLLTWKQKLLIKKYIDKLKKISEIEINYTNSLYADTDAEKFCGLLADPPITINTYGDIIFCCNTVGQGAVLGNLKNESLSKLFIKTIKKGVWLKEERKRRIDNKEFFKGFNSCHYCNLMLKKNIKKHKDYDKKNKLIVINKNEE